ncbi:transcriptional repressor [Cohnella lubricantis]|uniref:Transcriptional repressor n=1 Tax=Cohnella lubricantis TaxID=2163172 RepID=A0A841T6X7_9BACL|nr:transcriptional repressor [Cohnella lubricantis]MBB6676642.1 transcriptional repressor [Cohnella lubricantis]MBP2120440.1 Fur family peroxide stress response transcriptional regulator [Cohnella lubricantis]
MSRSGLTAPRKLILDIVSESHDHPTASDIIDRLKHQGQTVAYATVYNSLRYLTDNGMIRELKLEGDASRYDARTEDHHHIVCTSCGRVDEILTGSPKNWLQEIEAETGYTITEEQLLFKGVCAECRTLNKPGVQ